MKLIATIALVLGLTGYARADEAPAMNFQPKGVAKVIQWSVDPFDSNQAWALASDSLQFNSGLQSSQQWNVKFTRRTYQRLRGTDPKNLELLKILPSKKKPGNLFLMVGAESGRSQIFFTADYGDTWSYLGTRDRPSSATTLDSPPADSSGGAVDLNSLNTSASPAPSLGGSAGAAATSGAQFKIYFDLLLTNRPGISNFTFDNYHTFVLVDFIPKPGLQFSFDLSPTPRFYQLDYDITERLGFYAGRIIVPFDDMNPHNRFGGYINNSRTAQPGAAAFLPDIWADLGLGFRYKLLNLSNLTALMHVYVVNGFGAGGVDPVLPSSSYPNFGSVGAPDNNGDKAIGFRFQTDFFQMLSLVFSFHTGAWTTNPAPTNRLNIVGAHARLRPTPTTQLKIGYVYFSVDLPTTSALASFQRGGLYGELRQKFGQYWYAAAEMGVLQTDDRVSDPGDQLSVGGRLGYFTGMFDISVQYRRDLKNIAGKINRDYTAGRLAISL